MYKRQAGDRPGAPQSLEGSRRRSHPPASGGGREGGHRHAAGSAPACTFNGGPVVAAPKVVPIIFPGNALDPQIRDFTAKLQGSAYWQAATAEYGVGPITTLPVYVPTDPAPTADTLDAWIGGLAAAPPPGFPAPDDDTIYAIVLPDGWDAAGGACVTWGAYHSWHTLPSGQNVIYTVNPTCLTPYLGLLGINQITSALSHEIEEAATDPTLGGYYGVNWPLSGWASAAEGLPGGETADLCEFQPNAYYVDPGLGYMVQRVWSNQAAAGGHDPCRPLLPGSGPYFTAEAVVTEGTRVEPGVYARGVSIAPGSQVTVPVRLSSDGPMGEWQLSAAEEANPHLPPDVYGELSFSWDQASGHAGDTRHLTIKRSPPPPGGSPVFLRVAIHSTAGAVTHTSWLVVGDSAPPPAPQIESDGGPVLATARVVPVIYSADPLLAPLTDYFARLGTSGYLGSALGEYGVTGVTVTAPVVIGDAPPASMSDFDLYVWLWGLIDQGTLPAADGNTMFHVILPPQTQVIAGVLYGYSTPTCAPGTAETYSSAGGTAPFSYVPRCAGSTPGAGGVSDVTARGTQALVDALVNPFQWEAPAYGDPSWPGSGWSSLVAGSYGYLPAYGLGEMCRGTLHDATMTPADLGYLVPRIWSNQAAATGHDPCADPAATGAYFNAAPDIVGGTQFASSSFAKGVTIPVGGKITLPVRLFSDGPTDDWTLSAVERTDLAADPENVLSFSFDHAHGESGDVRLLTIARAATSDGSVATNLAFDIVSTRGSTSHEWLVAVGNE